MFISENKKVAAEQIKLIATALNTLGSGAIILGFLRPILAAAENEPFDPLGLIFAFFLAAMLYLAANRVLTRLPEEE